MAFPYENFYWVKIELETRFGRHFCGVVVYPNIAKVVDLTTGETINVFDGETRKELATADAIARMKYWDKHIYCCWEPVRTGPEIVIRAAEPQAKSQKNNHRTKR